MKNRGGGFRDAGKHFRGEYLTQAAPPTVSLLCGLYVDKRFLSGEPKPGKKISQGLHK